MTDGPLLIYDADCAFCQRCVDIGQRRLRRFPTSVGFQSLDLAAWGLTRAQAERSVQLRFPDGTMRSGAAAVASILIAQRRTACTVLGELMVTPPTSWLAACAYAVVARYRHHMPGATTRCRRPGM